MERFQKDLLQAEGDFERAKQEQEENDRKEAELVSQLEQTIAETQDAVANTNAAEGDLKEIQQTMRTDKMEMEDGMEQMVELQKIEERETIAMENEAEMEHQAEMDLMEKWTTVKAKASSLMET